MIITAQNILNFIETEYKENKGWLERNVLGYSKEMQAARVYLTGIKSKDLDGHDLLLTTIQMADLIHQLMPATFYVALKKQVRIAATFVVVVKLVRKMLTELDSSLTAETKEYLEIMHAFFGELDFQGSFSRSLKKAIGYYSMDLSGTLVLNKRVEADNWIRLYKADILNETTRKIIRSCPAAGDALITLHEYYTKDGSVSNYKHYQTVLKNQAKDATRWLVAVAKTRENNNAVETLWSSFEFFPESLVFGDISKCIGLLERVGMLSRDIIFMPVHLSSEEKAKYQIDVFSNTLDHSEKDYSASILEKALYYLKNSALLTQDSITHIFDSKVGQLFKTKESEQLIAQIPVTERTQTVWNKLVQCCQSNDPMNALYAYIMPIIAEKKTLSTYDQYQQRDDWFSGEHKRAKSDILEALRRSNIPVEMNSNNRQLLHARMLNWQPLGYERSRNLLGIFWFLIRCEPNLLTQAQFEFLLNPVHDIIVRNTNVYEFLNEYFSPEPNPVVCNSIWEAINRYYEAGHLELGIANLREFYRLMEDLQLLETFNCLLTPENDALLYSVEVHDMVMRPGFKNALEDLPVRMLTQEVWNAILRCALQNNLDAVQQYVRNLLMMPQNNEHINGQSVHLPSMHSSVTNALKKLHHRYHAKKSESTHIEAQINELDYFHKMLKVIYKKFEENRNTESDVMSIDQCIKQVAHLEKENNHGNRDEIEQLKNTISQFLESLREECLLTVITEPFQLASDQMREKHDALVEKLRPVLEDLLQSLGEGAFDFKQKHPVVKELGSAAKLDSSNRCLTRLRGLEISEQGTGYSSKKVLALVWEAVLDKAVHVKDKTEVIEEKEIFTPAPKALDNFINELFSMQDREGEHDNAACGSGSINDLLNPLNGVHPDVVLLMIDEANVIRMVHDEVKKWVVSSIPEEQDEVFLNHLDDANNHEMIKKCDEILSKVTINVMTRIEKNLEDAKFTAGQIRSIQVGGHYDIGTNAAIEKGVNWYKKKHYVYLRAAIKTDYLEKFPPEKQSLINIESTSCQNSDHSSKPADDFELLIQVIKEVQQAAKIYLQPKKVIIETADEDDEDKAITANTPSNQEYSINAGSVTNAAKNAFFQASIPDELISELIDQLDTKKHCLVIEWLESNMTKLTQGVFGRKLKDYFFTRGKAAPKKPFGCKDLMQLVPCMTIDQHVRHKMVPIVVKIQHKL